MALNVTTSGTSVTPAIGDNSIKIATTAFVQTALAPNITKIIQNYFGFIFLTSDSRLFAGGANTVGQLGNGSATTNDLYSEIQFPSYIKTNGYTIIDVTVIHNSVYCLFSNGDLYGWGENGYGQLATNNTTNQYSPVCIAGPSCTIAGIGVNIIVTNMFYPKNGYADEYNGASGQTYIFITDGTYYYGCGYNVQGNLGLVNTTSQSSWQAILTPDTGYAITKLWVGAQPQGTSFMQTSSGRLYACGLNSNGQLGIGNTTQQTSWVNVSYFGTTYTFTDIQSNGYNGTAFNSTTFLTSSGAFFTVGNGTYGQLGNGTTISITTPTQITFTGGLVIQKVIKAQLMVWIIFTNGTYTRWGFNVQGQLGNGTVTQQNSPVYSSSGDPGGATVTNIFATLPTGTNGNVVWQTFLLKPTGLYACGYNDAGCLGIGNNSLQATVSTQTLVNISNLNILDIKTTGTYNTATTSVMIFNNSCNVFGCGYNANYALNTSIVAQKNNFRNLNLLRSF